jgi:DNA repair protein RadC
VSTHLAGLPAEPVLPRRIRRSSRTAGSPSSRPSLDDAILKQAEVILLARMSSGRIKLSTPEDTIAYFKVRIGTLEHEQFEALWLNQQHRLLHVETLARGTINEASVYPREVIKAALRVNAAAVIFAHNHPSGEVEPSWADRALTRRLKDALALLDIRTLDHFVVSGNATTSFAERGWL